MMAHTRLTARKSIGGQGMPPHYIPPVEQEDNQEEEEFYNTDDANSGSELGGEDAPAPAAPVPEVPPAPQQ